MTSEPKHVILEEEEGGDPPRGPYGERPLQTLKNRPHLITRAPSQQSS